MKTLRKRVMKRTSRIILWAAIATIAATLTGGYLCLKRWTYVINEEVTLRNEYHRKKFYEMKFNGYVAQKEIRFDKDGKEYYLGIKSDSRFELDLTLPTPLYRINYEENVILCRITEEEYNIFQIGDSIIKTTGIEGAFRKNTKVRKAQ